MKRKTLLNSLGNAKILGIDKIALEKILNDLNLSLNSRAENLSIDDYNMLTKAYLERTKEK